MRTGGTLPFGHRFRPDRVTLVISTLAINVLSLALPVLSLQIYDRIIPSHGSGSLYVLVIGVAVALAMEAALRLCRTYLLGLNGAAYGHTAGCEAMQHLLGADLALRGSLGIAGDYHSLSSIKNLKELHNGQMLVSVVDLAFVPLFLGLIAYIGGKIALIAIVLLVIFSLLSVHEGRQLRNALSAREHHDDRRFNALISMVGAIHSVKAFALERALERRYESLQAESSKASYQAAGAINGTINQGSLFAQLMTATTVAYGAWLGVEGAITIGAMIAVVQLSGRLMQPIQRGLTLWARYQDLSLSKQRVDRLLATPLVVSEPAAELPENEGRLEVNNVAWAPSPDALPVFRNVSFELTRGRAISIGGAAGSGRTTLLRLIAGIQRPTEGYIAINGLKTTEFPPEAIGRHVGYMGTEGVMFRGTIRDNITRFGEVSTVQAMTIARYLGIDRDIAMLPGGLDTQLEGMASDTIPPGLSQRLAILRAICTKPRVLLFDNADRALDTNGYAQLYALLARLRSQTSMVLVSDDANLTGLASHHYVFEKGNLREVTDPRALAPTIVPYGELRL